MINKTNNIVIFNITNLDRCIRKSLNTVLEYLDVRYGAFSEQYKWKAPHGFQYMFSKTNIRSDIEIGGEFLNTALAFSALNSRNEGVEDLLDRFEDFLQGRRPPASSLAAIKQGIKLFLVELWNQNTILLPTIFSPGAHFDPILVNNELYSFIHKLKPRDINGGNFDENARRLFYYMPRIILATSWRKIEDVSLGELSELHRAQRLFKLGRGGAPFITSPVPWVMFAVELLKTFPERVSYKETDVVSYSQWTAGNIIGQCFADFSPIKKQKSVCNSLPKRRVASERLDGKLSDNKADELLSLTRSNRHDDALAYFQSYAGIKRNGVKWISESQQYPGREHVSLDRLVQHWKIAIQAFLKHRKEVKGCEDEKNVTSALNILADYLFLYLPWWKELYPGAVVSIPFSPKDFGRYAYFYRSAEEPLENFPATFPELLKLRRKTKDGVYAALKQVQLFFSFVEFFFSEDKDIAGPNFRSPIFEEFDLPRVPRNFKTTKVVFPKGAYRHLVHYVYAVEAMGEYLLAKCMANEFGRNELRLISGLRWLDTAALGFVPFVRVNGKLLIIYHLPNVFSWVARFIKNEKDLPKECFIPHLTTVRLLIAAIETGLRVAGLRWLDRRTWDQKNHGEPEYSDFSFEPSGRYIYSLFVNTDKTKEKPWVTEIVFRVRSLLLRENIFQRNIGEQDMDVAVPYQGREESRFGYIVPLFRGTVSANPISEANYPICWTLLLVGFQEFYSKVLGHPTFFVKVTSVKDKSRNSEPKIIVLEDGRQYCPVSILAINTPHACRATYATNRQGLIETSDISTQIGHNSELATTYYQAPRVEDLQEKLEATDRAIFDDSQRFEQDDASYIRPDKPDSAMARSFVRNREAAIKQFKVMPAIALWNSAETENMSSDAIEELRNGPMSLVRFHPTHICPVGDECPADIVRSIGDFKRCGICPLAIKGIDHLPAIAAKKNNLLERIRFQVRQRDTLEASGEIQAADELWDVIELDTNEWLGWQLSEEVLAKAYDEIMAGDGPREDIGLFHTDAPEIVRQHLRRVVKNSSEVEFLLCRIAESNAYPTMQTPQLQAVASGIRRRLLGGREPRDFLSELPGSTDITVASSLLKTVMQANQLSLTDISNQLTTQSVFPAKGHLRLGESS